MPPEVHCAFSARRPQFLQGLITQGSRLESLDAVVTGADAEDSPHALKESVLVTFRYWLSYYAIGANLLFLANYRRRSIQEVEADLGSSIHLIQVTAAHACSWLI